MTEQRSHEEAAAAVEHSERLASPRFDVEGHFPLELVRLTLSSVDPIEVADHVVERLTDQYGLKACSIWLQSEDGGWILQASQRGFAERQSPVPADAESDAARAVATGDTIARPDTSDRAVPEITRRVMDSLGPEPKSYLVVPMRVDTRAIGALILIWPAPREFGPDEVHTFDEIASVLALGFDHAQLVQRHMRSTQLLQAHVESSPLAVIEFDAQFRITQWTGAAERMFGYTAEEVLGKAIEELRWVHEDDERRVAAESARFVRGATGSKNVNRNYRKDGSVIWCEWYSSAIHDASGNLSSVLSLVLDVTERVMAEDAKQQELERTELLLAAGSALAREMALREVLQLLCETIVSIVDHRRAGVLLLAQEAGVVEMAASAGEPAVLEGFRKRLEDLSGPVRRVIDEQVSALVDYSTLADGERGLADAIGSSITFHVPLSYRGKLLGVLSVDDADEGRAFTQREMSLIEGVASQASVAIENARLYERQVEQAQRMEALKEIAETGSRAMRAPDLEDRLVETVMRITGAPAAAVVMTGEDGRLAPMAAHGYSQEYLDALTPLPPDSLGAQVFGFGESLWITDIESGDVSDFTRSLARSEGIRSVVVVPLRTGDRRIGVLALSWPVPQEANPSELAFIESVASQLAVAIENGRLYELERGIAETLQETLVIVPSQVAGVEFSRSYESATFERGRVGGDFVDIFEIAAPWVAITLGDVSGKGMDAAVTTSLIRTTLRVHAIDGLPPVAIAQKANQMMRRFSETESFVTLWFGLLNTETGQLRYVCAGHPPALVISPGGKVRELQAGDPILGAFDDATYFEGHAVLAQGERLLLYSDGATEARSPLGGFLGMDGLCEIVAEHAAEPTSTLTDLIMRDIVTFSEGVLRDDAALLAAEPTNLGATSQ